MSTIYEIASEIEKDFTWLDEEKLIEKIIYRIEEDPEAYQEALKNVAAPLARRILMRRANITRESRINNRISEQEITSVATLVVQKIITKFIDTLRMPDGRLFGDVPWYELDELQRTHIAWAGLIQDVKMHVIVSNPSSTVRQNIKSETLEKFAKARDLAPENRKTIRA